MKNFAEEIKQIFTRQPLDNLLITYRIIIRIMSRNIFQVSSFSHFSKISSAEIRVRHRWSIGQSRSIQGEQSTSFRIISAPMGCVVFGFVGPNITIVLVPRAAEIWAGPVSFETNRSQRLKTAVDSANDVLPVKLTGLIIDFSTTSILTSSSLRSPIKITSDFNSFCRRSFNPA